MTKQRHPYPFITEDEITDYNYSLKYLENLIGKKIIDKTFGGNPFGGYAEFTITAILKTVYNKENPQKVEFVMFSTDKGYEPSYQTLSLIYLIEVGMWVNAFGWTIEIRENL